MHDHTNKNAENQPEVNRLQSAVDPTTSHQSNIERSFQSRITAKLRGTTDQSLQQCITAQLKAHHELDDGKVIVQGKLGMEGASSPNQSDTKVPNNTGLPSNLKSGIENLSGYPMDDVKVHYNSSKPSQLQAHAFAQGTDIHVSSGQERHLPHEAWHIVQQKQGRVKPTRQMKGGAEVNDDIGLEQEADIMGAKALQHESLIVNDLSHSGSENTRFSKPIVQKIGSGVIQRGVNMEEMGLVTKGEVIEFVSKLCVSEEVREQMIEEWNDENPADIITKDHLKRARTNRLDEPDLREEEEKRIEDVEMEEKGDKSSTPSEVPELDLSTEEGMAAYIAANSTIGPAPGSHRTKRRKRKESIEEKHPIGKRYKGYLKRFGKSHWPPDVGKTSSYGRRSTKTTVFSSSGYKLAKKLIKDQNWEVIGHETGDVIIRNSGMILGVHPNGTAYPTDHKENRDWVERPIYP